MEERKKVGVIQYYNVLFIMELMTDKDIWYMEQLSNGIDRMYMNGVDYILLNTKLYLFIERNIL